MQKRCSAMPTYDKCEYVIGQSSGEARRVFQQQQIVGADSNAAGTVCVVLGICMNRHQVILCLKCCGSVRTGHWHAKCSCPVLVNAIGPMAVATGTAKSGMNYAGFAAVGVYVVCGCSMSDGVLRCVQSLFC